ncbi:MAG TPA: DNA repair protein RecO [Anaerolineae bacterium]|nr:DNA repair protein RecO [Anaerolineae bacterium]
MPDRSRLYRIDAIILHRSDLGEADRLLSVLSRDLGKLRVNAKGARKTASRKGGHIELFTRSKMLIAKGRGDIDIVSQVEMTEPYRGLHEDLTRSTYAHYAVELVDAFAEEGTAQPEIFDLLAEALGWIATSSNLPLAMRYFELQLLTHAGFQPQVFFCAAGGERLIEIQADESYGWSPNAGGAICPTHAQGRADVGRLSLNALKVVRYALRNIYPTFIALSVSEPVQREIEQAMLRYVQYVLERRVKSIEFLNLLRRESE